MTKNLLIGEIPKPLLERIMSGPAIYGLCPGCRAWQLEVPNDALGAEVENAMQDHADTECPGLKLIAERLANAGRYGPLPLMAAPWGYAWVGDVTAPAR